jgi:hypothetical protein
VLINLLPGHCIARPTKARGREPEVGETVAFHFMRAIPVENRQMTPEKIGVFLTFGKMGNPLAVKR